MPFFPCLLIPTSPQVELPHAREGVEGPGRALTLLHLCQQLSCAQGDRDSIGERGHRGKEFHE